MRAFELLESDEEIDVDVDNGSSSAAFRRVLVAHVKGLGLKLIGSNKNGTEIRFSLEGDQKDFEKFFKPLGIQIVDSEISLSAIYSTYDLELLQPWGDLIPPAKLHWTNSFTGGAESTHKFGDKELTPDDLGLAGETKNAYGTIMKTVFPIIEEKYSDHAAFLSNLAKLSTGQGNAIDISSLDIAPYSTSDLATVSKNYGEILSAIWGMKNLEYEEVSFPSTSNAALIDFYAMVGGEELPISVKSGGGGKVTIQNIMDALGDKVAAGKVNPEEEESYEVFKTVKENSSFDGIVQLHVLFKTKLIRDISKITKISLEEMSVLNIAKWIDDKDGDELKKLLIPWHDTIPTKISEKFWYGKDKRRLIISPLGEYIWKYLNNDTPIRESMSRLAKNLTIIQINVDVKRKSVMFNSRKFGDAEFEFGWAGYSGGNKIGFKMSKEAKGK